MLLCRGVNRGGGDDDDGEPLGVMAVAAMMKMEEGMANPDAALEGDEMYYAADADLNVADFALNVPEAAAEAEPLQPPPIADELPQVATHTSAKQNPDRV